MGGVTEEVDSTVVIAEATFAVAWAFLKEVFPEWFDEDFGVFKVLTADIGLAFCLAGNDVVGLAGSAFDIVVIVSRYAWCVGFVMVH